MEGLADNQALLNSLLLVLGGVFVCASEALPWFNDLLNIVPFPTPEFRYYLLVLLVLNIGICFLWDRAMVWIFEPEIFKVSLVGSVIEVLVLDCSSSAHFKVCGLLLFLIQRSGELG